MLILLRFSLIIGLVFFISCEDTTPPSVSITSHTTGSIVNEMVTLIADAEDEQGISKVEFFIDGVLVFTDFESPFQYLWNTLEYDNDSEHSIRVVAYDKTDNSATEELSLIVDNSTAVPRGSNVTSVTYTLTEMMIEWEASTDGDFKEYTILYSTSETGEKQTLATQTDISITSHSILEFNPAVENWFYIQVTDTLGLSSVGTGMTNDLYDENVTLFSATFHEEYDLEIKSFVYISDSLGAVISDTSFYGSGSFVFNKKYPFASTIPKKIGITTVTEEYDNMSLISNLGVDIGSDFHYYNPYPLVETIGYSYYNFINIPSEFYRIIINTKGRYLRLSYDSYNPINEDTQVELSHYHGNEDVIVMVYYDDGTAESLVIDNVQIESYNEIDFSNLTSCSQHVISNNTGLVNDYLGVDLFVTGDSYLSYYRMARLDPYGQGLNKTWNSDGDFIVNIPLLSFTSEITVDAHVGDSYYEPGGKNYRHSTSTGSLPSSIEKIDADFSLINSDINNFQISHYGEFDQWRVALHDSSTGVSWSVYNSSSTSTMILPDLPISVVSEYSELSDPSFYYTHIILTDWDCAESYKEWVELFHSSDGYYRDFCSGFRNLRFLAPEQ